MRAATPPPHLTLNTSSRGTPAAVPNKHIPICSPGPTPVQGLVTPPASPPSKELEIETASILCPPDAFDKLVDDPPVYSVDARTVARALDHVATQPLPDPNKVFPWLHGLHAENQIQNAFFVGRRKSLRKTPKCIRGVTVVKAGGDMGGSKLKGAIAPEELLLAQGSTDDMASFVESDPRDGFSVRNFQIQACKMATVSDIVVYGDESTPRDEVVSLARSIAGAQRAWREKRSAVMLVDKEAVFNTFVVAGES